MNDTLCCLSLPRRRESIKNVTRVDSRFRGNDNSVGNFILPKPLNSKKQGAALLVVLFIIMAITILSLGFLSRSDVELACGQNMILRTQMDYLAESGLEHAKGLILNPQDFKPEEIVKGYWEGAKRIRLDEDSSDYYDVEIVRDSNYCNYFIECTAYREKTVDQEIIRVGQSSLSAELRLDSCIALSVGQSTTLWSNVTVNGDVNCVGILTNQGKIYGDVFADDLIGIPMYPNQEKSRQVLQNQSFTWPNVTVDVFKGKYDEIYYLYDPNIIINNGMLLIEGDLTISGTNNIVACKNLPALYVTKDLIIEEGASLEIEGLAVIDGRVLLNEKASLNVLGGLFIRGTLSGTNASVTITAEPSKTAIITWSEGTPQKWGQAAGAFFRSIRRQ